MTLKNSTASSSLEQINAEFNNFLTELSIEIPNLKPGKILNDKKLEKERLEQEVKDREIITNKILHKIIIWVNEKSKTGIEKARISKAINFTLHPDKLNHTSKNAQYLKESLLSHENKGFYFDKVRTHFQENKQINSSSFRSSSEQPQANPFAGNYEDQRREHEEKMRKQQAEEEQRSKQRAEQEQAKQKLTPQEKQERAEQEAQRRREKWWKQEQERAQQAEKAEQKQTQQTERQWKRQQEQAKTQKAKKQAQKEQNKINTLAKYCDDIAFTWNLLKTYFVKLLLVEALIMIGILILILASTILEIQLALTLLTIYTNAEIALIFFVIAFTLMPGILSLFTNQSADMSTLDHFLIGHLFLLKIILMTPIAAILTMENFVNSLFSEKSIPKAAQQSKKQKKKNPIPSPYAEDSPSESEDLVSEPEDSPSEAEEAPSYPKASLSESEESSFESEEEEPEAPRSPRSSFRAGFGSADDFD